MTKNPKMITTVHQDAEARKIFVVVEHGIRQSYSRSVYPKAKRAVVEHLTKTGQYLVTYIEQAALGTGYTQNTAEGDPENRRVLSVFFVTY